MNSHPETEVYRVTDVLCKVEVTMDLAVDMPTKSDQGESVNYIP